MNWVSQFWLAQAANHTWNWSYVDFISNWYTKPNAVMNVFEYDPWPASTHTTSISGLNMSFRSYETIWFATQLDRSSSDSFRYDDGKILFAHW